MKRLQEILKPFLAIILGALLLLRYLNWLQGQNQTLAIGIIAMVLAALYLSLGILGFTLNNRLPSGAKKAFSLTAVVAFPLFLFVYFLLLTIRIAEDLGPNGWFLAILKMIAALSFAVVFLLAGLLKNRHLNKLALLLASVFVLALLLEALFDAWGDPVGLGSIIVVEVVIFFLYGNILFNSLPNAKGEPAPEVAPQQEHEEAAEAEEPAPEEETKEEAEEAPAEE